MPSHDDSATFACRLNAARNGDADALGRILKSLERCLRNQIRQRLTPELRAWARESDFIQDAFVEALKGLPDFRGNTDREFCAWLVRIVLNNLKDCHRLHVAGRKRCAAATQSLDDGLRASLLAESLCPAEAVVRAEEAARAREALEQLSPLRRTAVTLHFAEGRSFSEIGRGLYRSADSVRKVCDRAIHRVRQLMAVEPEASTIERAAG